MHKINMKANSYTLRFILSCLESPFHIDRNIISINTYRLENETAGALHQAQLNIQQLTKEKAHTVTCADLIYLLNENDYTLHLFICLGLYLIT